MLYYMGYAPMENRNGLVSGGPVTQVNGTASGKRRPPICAPVRFHIGRNDRVIKASRRHKTAIDGRTPRHAGYAIS
jgi:hypothetical protein